MDHSGVLAPWRLGVYFLLRPSYLKTRRERGRESAPPDELRVPDIRLEAPVEDHVIPVHVRDAEGAVTHRRAFGDLEDVPVGGDGLEQVAAVPRRGREVDGREVRHLAVHLDARAAEHR